MFLKHKLESISSVLLCGAISVTLTQITLAQNTPQTREEILDMSALVYADSYCEARAQGMTHRQASEQSTRPVVEYLMYHKLTIDDLASTWYQTAKEKSEIMCPELQPTGSYN